MAAARYKAIRLWRAFAVPLVVALPPLPWVAVALQRAALTPLGRDQGIFQYIAWALGRGAVDYRDIRDVNGPLTHFVHLAFLALGGGDEHRFRVLDLIATSGAFAFVGACLPGLGGGVGRASGVPARLRFLGGVPALERLAWAGAGWVVLSGQYLLYGYWDLAQRESFFDWFMLPSVALQLAVQALPATRCAPLLVLVGATSIVPWFGKPTYLLFTLAQLMALCVDDGLALAGARGRALGAFVAGGVLGAGVALALLAVLGDVRAFARIEFADVPAMYRFIWPRAPMDIFSHSWAATQAIFALTGTALLLALISVGQIPRRALAVALVPACALGSVGIQAKGFPYHFHPVTAGLHLQWLLFAAWISERARVARRDRALVRLFPLATGAAIAVRLATAMEDSPHVRAVWLLWGAASSPQRVTKEYFAHFPEVDFFPYEMRQAAAYLRDHTRPTDRVQTYGMDPYVLFLAERASATPYIYAYDLNADAALTGGTGGNPDDLEQVRIRELRDAHEADLRARLESDPPAAFVFFDGAPLLSRPDAWDDFSEHCTRAAPWVAQHYRETAQFGHDHVWLRSDLAAREGSGGPEYPPSSAPERRRPRAPDR
jgi:hypothetical protein